MKHLLITFIALCMYCTCANAQQTISLQQLNGTTWKEVSNDAPYITLKFTKTNINDTADYTVGVAVDNYPYYLETKEPTTFSLSKVGKNATGCYIVKYNTKIKVFIYYKVVSLKNDTLTLYYEPDENAIGGNSKRGFNIVYKRVK